MALENYYGLLDANEGQKATLEDWEANPKIGYDSNTQLHQPVYDNRSRRADTIYAENFKTGDILIYQNKQTATSSDNVPFVTGEEDGTFYLTYFEDDITVDGKTMNGFIGRDPDGNVKNISKNYKIMQSLLAKDYYVVLRPALTMADAIEVTTLPNWSTTFSTSAQTKVITGITNNTVGSLTYAIKSQPTGLYFSIPTASENKLRMAGNTPVGTYSLVITVTTEGDALYSSASKDITLEVTVGKAVGSIRYANQIVNKTYGDVAFTNELTKIGDGVVTYRSSDTSVATVDTTGKVTIMKVGSTTITATVEDGENYTYATKTASYTLTVGEAPVVVVPVTEVTLNKEEMELTIGENETLTETVLPNDATDKTVTWSTSDEKVATVENGKVTAVGEGTAIITVTTKDGNKISNCLVTVTKPMTPILRGDVNLDGKLTLKDVRLMMEKVVNKEYTAEEIPILDYNEDGKASLLDVRLLLDKVVNKL